MTTGRMPKKQLKKPTLMKAVNYVGGVCQLAKLLKVAPSTLSMWMYNNIKIKVALAERIEVVTIGKIKAIDVLNENPKEK